MTASFETTSTVEPTPLSQDDLRKNFYENSIDMRNTWYPILPSAELTTLKPLGLHILDDPIVMFRDPATKEACIFEDKCPHRSAPLSVGRIIEGKLECRYHGWTFNNEGKVDHIPSLLAGKRIPANAKVRKYPTHESDEWVWVWPGDLEKYLKPRYGYEDLDIDHSLLVENFLDPAHIPFTHDTTIGKRSMATALTMSLDFTPEGTIHGIRSTPDRPDMSVGEFEFRPPCCVALKFHLNDKINDQTFYAIPLEKGKCRFIYLQRFSFLQFMESNFILKAFMDWWAPKYNHKVLMEDYAMLKGQQERLLKGANAMNSPVAADIMIKTYRNWWRKAIRKNGGPYFKGYSNDIEDIVLNGCASKCGPSASASKDTANTFMTDEEDSDGSSDGKTLRSQLASI
ncbi:Rieske [2Fe-2S] iron-sulfur domain-containing protein [Chytridium lagenaria]|nr:Rieske [2Fe-2S] iron-sulfur domain-containing protein [Chytridium lagenaria]